MSIPVLLWLAVTISCDGSPAIFQKPQSVVESPGGRATLDCFLEESSNPNFYWYRGQRPGGQLEQLTFSISTGMSQNLGPEHIKGERPKDNTFTLRLTTLLANDTGTYYCAWSRQGSSGYEQTFGAGTKLTVLESEDDISPPTVTIFDPSAQELQEKQKVTIVCLVTDFYPDHVNLTWSVDGDERTKGVKTKEPDLDEAAKKFSLISRLRITRKEWEKTKEIQCNVYFDPDKRNYTGTIRGQVCDGSDALKEPYLRSNNLGKLIYILLIFKSTLYGAFITGLMLRKKSMKEKPFA
nr:TRBV9 [Sphenodon punctatus]